MVDVSTAQARAAHRAYLDAHPAARVPVDAANIAAVLDLDPDALEALVSGARVGGYDPRWVALQLYERWAVPPDEPLGRGLARLGVLTDAEGR